ncbi:hypothetical protein OE749_06415 [Aestuariibacter sp. AA17]|uniref:Secreted protein n=1 Tax=Fluctibacter corallii TaxID=2984329 RepID=A0ABT3A6V1_9ALTE|nr:hypothetical protein [Aestuariibacter sp. AA17]MCV2884323.1 hypothetical protein [Aestuariibacter sp. AA17]
MSRFVQTLNRLLGLFTVTSATITMSASHASYVQTLKVKGNHVLFSTSAERQQHAACVTNENEQFWSLSLNTESGRASYSLLMLALDQSKSVNIEPANDCADISGVERAESINVNFSSMNTTANTGKIAAMVTGDEKHQVGIIITAFSKDRWAYVGNTATSELQYYDAKPSLSQVYYSGSNCTGTPLSEHTIHQWNPYFANGNYVQGNLNNTVTGYRSIRNLSTQACQNSSNSAKNMYILEEAPHPLCGTRPCKVIVSQ